MKFNLTILKTILMLILINIHFTTNAINIMLATSPNSKGGVDDQYLKSYYYLNITGVNIKPSFQIAPRENPAKSIMLSIDDNLLYNSIILNIPIIIYEDSQYHTIFKANTGANLGTYSFMAQAQYCTITLTWLLTNGGYYTATPSVDNCNFPETL